MPHWFPSQVPKGLSFCRQYELLCLFKHDFNVLNFIPLYKNGSLSYASHVATKQQSDWYYTFLTGRSYCDGLQDFIRDAGDAIENSCTENNTLLNERKGGSWKQINIMTLWLDCHILLKNPINSHWRPLATNCPYCCCHGGDEAVLKRFFLNKLYWTL